MIRKTTILLVVALAFAFLACALVVSALPKDGKKVEITPGVRPEVPQRLAPAPTPQLPVVYDEDQWLENPPHIPGGYVPRSLGPTPVSAATPPFFDMVTGTAPDGPGGNNRMRRQAALSSDGKVHVIYKASPGGDYFDSFNVYGVPYYYNALNCDAPDSVSFVTNPRARPLRQTYPAPYDTLLRPRLIGALGGIFTVAGNVPLAYADWYRHNANTVGPNSYSRLGSSQAHSSGQCSYDFVVDTLPLARNGSNQRLQPVMEKANDNLWIATYRVGSNPFTVGTNRTTDGGQTWSAITNISGYASAWYNAVDVCANASGSQVLIFSHTDPANLQAFQTTEHPCYVRSTDGGATWGSIQEVTAIQHRPGYLANMLRISCLMIEDTAHVLWSDWNNWNGNGFAGVGSHVWHAAVEPNDNIVGPHLVANINIDGREPDNTATLFGSGTGNFGDVNLCYRPASFGKDPVLYALWAQAPDNGASGYADSTDPALAHLAVMDIWLSASPNNGLSWDEAQNVTQTNSPGCNGTSTPCADEQYFSTPQRAWVGVSDTAQWFIPTYAFVRAFPGDQESAVLSGIAPDGGPHTYASDKYRLYKVPARDPVVSLRGDLGPAPAETTALHRINVFPRAAGITSVKLALNNVGLVGFFADSVKLGSGLNDGALVTTLVNSHVGDFFGIATGQTDIELQFNSQLAGQGLRSGLLTYYLSGGAQEKVLQVELRVYVTPVFCFNNLQIIESGTNLTFVGTQGSVSDQSGIGLYNQTTGLTLFYDGGVLVHNPALNGLPSATGAPRRVTRQIFQDKFLRCASNYDAGFVLGSGYQNNYLKTVSTDIDDSSLIFLNIWEQSTHPDSSEFLMQTVKVINTSASPVANIDMGVLYDIDVFDLNLDPPQGANPGLNTNGDTVIAGGDGRFYHLGWQSGEDYTASSGDLDCNPNNEFYGAIFIPGSTGSVNDTIGPAGAVFYKQRAFSYNIDDDNLIGGDSMAQRYCKYVVGMHSTEQAADDSLTGVVEDSMDINGRCHGVGGNAFSDDDGYMAIVKRATVQPNDSIGTLVARYGLDGVAAAIDPAFAGPGETYTVIHLSAYNGFNELVANAQTAIAWYNAHANTPIYSVLNGLRGDLNFNGELNPGDVVNLLVYSFVGVEYFNPDPPGPPARFVSGCIADTDGNGTGGEATDVVALLKGAFVDPAQCPWCLKACL